jgi:hypothetical protein
MIKKEIFALFVLRCCRIIVIIFTFLRKNERTRRPAWVGLEKLRP